MPAPDINYFLDNSLIFSYLGGDSHYYLRRMAANTNHIVDSTTPKPVAGRRYMSALLDQCLTLESVYLDWRHTAPPESQQEACFLGLKGLGFALQEHIDDVTGILAAQGFSSLTPAARSFLQAKRDHKEVRGVMRRSLRRTSETLMCMSRAECDELEQRVILRRRRAFEQIRDADRPMAERRGDVFCGELFGDPKAISREVRAETKKRRNVIKRSIKFATRFVGADVTRVFLSGSAVRFEGEHCFYELTLTGDLTEAHGASKLSVFDKVHPDLHLCDVCVFTPDTPVLDHIVNIHTMIKAGCEADILSIGNPYNVKPGAAEREWLAPHLPKPEPNRRIPRSPGDLRDLINRLDNLDDEDISFNRRFAALNKAYARELFDNVLSDFMPMLQRLSIFQQGILQAA